MTRHQVSIAVVLSTSERAMFEVLTTWMQTQRDRDLSVDGDLYAMVGVLIDAIDAAERTVVEDRLVAALKSLGSEHEPPAGWDRRVLAAVSDPDTEH